MGVGVNNRTDFRCSIAQQGKNGGKALLNIVK